ncbi:MAG: DnaA/Hda family protein [Pirellulales bacterium]
MKDDTEIVCALRTAVADRVGQQRFAFWFGQGDWLSIRDGAVVLGVPNAFYQDWVKSQFRQQIEAGCLDALGSPLPLKFEIQSWIADAQSNAPPATTEPADSCAPGDASIATAATREAGANRQTAVNGTALTNASEAKPASRRRFARLETFAPGETNRLAWSTARLAVQEPGKWSPLYLHGPTGVGKTHLLEGIWTASREARRQSRVLYLTSEQFTSYFLNALHGSGMPNFRNKHRHLDLLLIDELQHFRGKPRTVEELLRTIDSITRAGKQVVLAGDTPPDELADFSPELAMRVQAGMVCHLSPPDLDARRGIVDRLAAAAGLTLPESVAEFLAARLVRSGRELAGAINRLHAESLAHGLAITLGLAEAALADLIRRNTPAFGLPEIEKAVCHAFNMQPDSLQAPGKSSRVSHPRMLAMWLARKYTRTPLAEIGRYFGGRSHSTVVSAQQKIDSLLAGQGPLQMAGGTWQADEAIRRVEDKLRAM